MSIFVYKLKRHKALYIIMNIITMPIRFPLFLFYKLGELSENILDYGDNQLCKLAEHISKVFKFESIARKQKESGLYGDKFNERE